MLVAALSDWTELLHENGSTCYVQVEYRHKRFWLKLRWNGDMWACYICRPDAQLPTMPGQHLTPNIFLDVGAKYNSVWDFPLAEFGATDAAKQWLDANWDSMVLRLGHDFI